MRRCIAAGPNGRQRFPLQCGGQEIPKWLNKKRFVMKGIPQESWPVTRPLHLEILSPSEAYV
jgi:hypothetical protein